MSLVTVVGKKTTSKKKVVRLRIINKIKNAFNFAVVRGAKVVDGKIVLDKEAPRQHLIHQGKHLITVTHLDAVLRSLRMDLFYISGFGRLSNALYPAYSRRSLGLGEDSQENHIVGDQLGTGIFCTLLLKSVLMKS